MPASASPSPTLVSTDLTSCSWLTGVTLMPALANVVVEYVPQGTPGAQTSTLIAGPARSDSAAMCFGLPACTAISSLLWAKTAGVPAVSPPVTTFCMFAWSAEANTSAGGPRPLWGTSGGPPAEPDFPSQPRELARSPSPPLVD